MNREFHRFVVWDLFAHKTWLWGVLVCAVFVTFHPGCTSDPPLSQSALTFRQQTLEDFERLVPNLLPAFDGNNPDMTSDEVIIEFLLALHDNGRHVLGLGVLDPSGNYRVGYRLGDTAPGSIEKSGYEEMSFASFKGIEKVVSSREIVQVPLYFQKQKVLVVGAPLVKEDRLLGIMCLSFDTGKFEEEWGISEQEFLRIDFNVK